MVDGADAEHWSSVADGWSRFWGGFARPAQERLITEAGIGPRTRVLDVGSGAGELLTVLSEHGARAVGVDPADGMRSHAAAAGHEVRHGDAEHLPFPAGSFDVVTAVNSLQFADSTQAALREFARVLTPGGRIAIANWADAEHNDLDVIERAVAAADLSETPPDGPLRSPGGLQSALTDAGLEVAASGIVDAPWQAPDDDSLVAGVLLGESEAFIAEMRPVVLAAAAPFRSGSGYLLRNRFRWAVAIRD